MHRNSLTVFMDTEQAITPEQAQKIMVSMLNMSKGIASKTVRDSAKSLSPDALAGFDFMIRTEFTVTKG